MLLVLFFWVLLVLFLWVLLVQLHLGCRSGNFTVLWSKYSCRLLQLFWQLLVLSLWQLLVLLVLFSWVLLVLSLWQLHLGCRSCNSTVL